MEYFRIMAKKYVKLDGPIKSYSPEEVRDLLGGLKNSELLRSIILNEKEFIDIDYDRSLRSFWYRTVKPSLEKLRLLTENDQTEEGLTKWDMELSRYMGELVKMGVLTYRDLRVVDESRRRETPRDRYSTTAIETYGYKTNIAPYPNIVICTEKDTVYSYLEDLSMLFGCSCISGKGQNSLGATEDLARRFDPGKDIFILAMTDYDPAGYSIAETFKNQLQSLKGSLKLRGRIVLNRVGIYPNQLTDQEVEQNKYTPKPKGRDKWFRLTGGIKGEPKGLELDAFSPHRIKEIFIEGLREYVDGDVYNGPFIKEAYIRIKVLEGLQDIVDRIAEEVTLKEFNNIEVIPVDIFDLALQEHTSLPVGDMVTTNRDQAIKDIASSYFNNTKG